MARFKLTGKKALQEAGFLPRTKTIKKTPTKKKKFEPERIVFSKK